MNQEKMANIQRRQVSMDIEAPLTGAIRRMYFNRFSLEHATDHVLMHFGYVDSQSFLFDVYTCAIRKEDVEVCRGRLLAYLGKTGNVGPDAARPWIPPQERRPIDTCNFIHMAYGGDRAEVLLCHFSAAGLAQRMKNSTNALAVQPDTSACLTCALPAQQAFLLALYPDAGSGRPT
jgi:hypothetical protein